MTSRAVKVIVYVLVGVAAALAGLLPWLVTGLRLPLQNLWATDTPSDQMPIALLPFSQYAITLIAALVVMGSAVAGLVLRITGSGRSRSALFGTIAGVLVVQIVAVAQTIGAVSGGLEDSIPASVYLGALVAGTIVAVFAGLVVLVLIGRTAVPGAVIGLCVAAVGLGSWVDAFVVPFGTVSDDGDVSVLGVTRWIPAVAVGLAIAWGGLAGIARIAAAIVGLLALWIGPSLFTAVSAAAGSRALYGDPAELLDFGRAVFVSALTAPEVSLQPIVVAVVVALVGWGLLRLVGRRSSRTHSERISA